MTTKERKLRQEESDRDRASMANAAACASRAADGALPQAVVEAALLERLRRGDRDAAGEFYDLYAARVHRFILHTLGTNASRQDAEDLMQETFIAVAEALPFFRGDSTLFTFTCAIAHRKALSFVRTNSRRARIASTVPPPGETGAVASSGDERIGRALASLKIEYREVLHLKYVDEAATAEIAAILRTTEHAVESRLKRARAALRALLEKDESP